MGSHPEGCVGAGAAGRASARHESNPLSLAAATSNSPPAASCHGSSEEDSGQGSFFLWRGCQTARLAKTIELSHTDHLSELVLYLLLESTPSGLWCLAPSGIKEVEDEFARFRGMSVSAIHRCSIALSAIRLPPGGSGGATGLHSSAVSGFLPGLSCLHQFHHLLFCASSLRVIHAWLLAHQ